MLTDQALKRLRRAPLGESGNRVATAVDLLETTFVAVSDATGLPYSYVTDVARGRFQTITVQNAHKFADFVGCHIEDLFPARQAMSA